MGELRHLQYFFLRRCRTAAFVVGSNWTIDGFLSRSWGFFVTQKIFHFVLSIP